MRRTLGGVKCNTDTARLIGDAGGIKLYKTKSQKFFVHDADVNDVYRITDDEARAWLLRHYGAEKAQAAFTDEDARKISLDLPAGLVKKIDAARDGVKRTRAAVIKSILEANLK